MGSKGCPCGPHSPPACMSSTDQRLGPPSYIPAHRGSRSWALLPQVGRWGWGLPPHPAQDPITVTLSAAPPALLRCCQSSRVSPNTLLSGAKATGFPAGSPGKGRDPGACPPVAQGKDCRAPRAPGSLLGAQEEASGLGFRSSKTRQHGLKRVGMVGTAPDPAPCVHLGAFAAAHVAVEGLGLNALPSPP